MIMATVLFEYNEIDKIASGMFGAIVAIPDMKAFFGDNIQSKEGNAKKLKR